MSKNSMKKNWCAISKFCYPKDIMGCSTWYTSWNLQEVPSRYPNFRFQLFLPSSVRTSFGPRLFGQNQVFLSVLCLAGCYLQCWCILCLSVYIHMCSQALTCCSMRTIPQACRDLSQESCIAVKGFECSTFFHKSGCNIIIFCVAYTEQIPCYDVAGILTAWCLARGAG